MRFYPAGLPRPLQASYTAKHKPNMLRTTMADGYARQRLVNQGAPDQVSVQLLLTEEQYCALLRWYKGDIQSGAAWFVMPLLRVEGAQAIQYRCVRIVNGELTATLLSTNAAVGGIYRVAFTLDASNTVVDDGSWNEHYTPTADTGEIITPINSMTEARAVFDDLADGIYTYTVTTED